jgi:predicted secreted Zn-dependent protease
MFRSILAATVLLAISAPPAVAATISKTYSYFSVGGRTLDEIESDLMRRGPKVKSSGRRHPGATQMEFISRISYGQQGNSCRIVGASVTVKAKVILPKWRRPKGADADVRLIWDTLEADIKRHEESHIIIAKNHARELEQALVALRQKPDCEQAAAAVKATTNKILARHDRAQVEFDKVEGINFESRIVRLLRYRMERMETGSGYGGLQEIPPRDK